MLTLDEIKNIETQKKTIKKEIYKKIYEDFCKKIKQSVSYGHKQIILNTPSYLFGYPSYDVEKATLYMERQFSHSGFVSRKLSSNELYVSWDTASKQQHQEMVVPDADDDFPTFVNLKKMASKLRKQ